MTTALPACQGVFVRAHCLHPRLFEEEYKRSNRNRGTKILRCFPHCCPRHVDRSYCGSSLEVVLRFEDNSQAENRDFDVANIFVFARFETVDSVHPPVDAYSLHHLRSISQSETNPEASWIEGVRQTAANRQQHSQQLHGRQPTLQPSTSTDSATFVLNGQAFAKWYYHWESGANKVQRATKHALKAYVFYQTAQTPDGELKLICIVTSPPFTVVSYRRAPLDASATFAGSPGAVGMDAASLVPHYATDTAHPVDSGLRRLVQSQISRAFHEYNQQCQYESQGSPDEQFASHEASEGQQVNAERNPLDRYRRLQEREGLRFRLSTPEDAALSGSSLPGQIQPREPRLVFDSKRRRDGHQHWRDTDKTIEDEFGESYDEDDDDEEAVPQPLTAQHWQLQSASLNEMKAAGPVGIPPSTTDPIGPAEQAGDASLLRFQQQQQQFDNHRREVQQLTDLAIIQFFVSRITNNSARGMANLEVVLTVAISQHWRFASGGATNLARLLLAIADGNGQETPRQTSSLDWKREEVMFVLGEICLWAFSPDNVELMQSSLAACYPLLLENRKLNESGDSDDEKMELHTAFMTCVTRCWSALDIFLRSPRTTQTTIRSVRELSDAVLGVVYSDPELQELRSGLRNLLQRPAIVLEDSKENSSAGSSTRGSFTPRCNLVGWRGFLAQVREGYLRAQYSSRSLPWSPGQGTSARPSRWTADWLLQPNSLSATPHTDSQRGTFQAEVVPSMWTSCLALSQLLHLKLAAVGDPFHTLYVQAVPSVLFQDNAWLRLICDGRVRVAPVAPNGLTSLMGGSSYGFGGDYVAYRLESQSGSGAADSQMTSDTYPIYLEFYWWPLGRTSYGEMRTSLVAFRSVVTLKTAASGAFMEAQMELERGFIQREAIAEMPELELWTPTERVQAVTTWHSWLSIEGVYARK